MFRARRWQGGDAAVTLANVRALAAGMDHPAGLARSGDVLYTSGEAGQLYRISSDGGVEELLSTGGHLAGLALDANGSVLACDRRKGVVWRIDPGERSSVSLGSGPRARPLTNPISVAVEPDGRAFIADAGAWHGDDGALVVRSVDGEWSVWASEIVAYPSGLALSPDGRELFITTASDASLLRVSIEPDGGAGSVDLVTRVPGAVLGGIAIAPDGAVYMACYRPDAVVAWHPTRGLELVAHNPEGAALTGPIALSLSDDLRELAVANASAWSVSIVPIVAGESPPHVDLPAH